MASATAWPSVTASLALEEGQADLHRGVGRHVQIVDARDLLAPGAPPAGHVELPGTDLAIAPRVVQERVLLLEQRARPLAVG
jgi:hypothetical protein